LGQAKLPPLAKVPMFAEPLSDCYKEQMATVLRLLSKCSGLACNGISSSSHKTTNLEALFKNFLGQGSTDRAVDSNLLVSSDAEGTDSVTS